MEAKRSNCDRRDHDPSINEDLAAESASIDAILASLEGSEFKGANRKIKVNFTVVDDDDDDDDDDDSDEQQEEKESKADDHSVVEGKVDNVDLEAIEVPGVNPQFFKWYNDNKNEVKEELTKVILSKQAELCEKSEQEDAAVILLFQLVLGMWVVCDYFAVQVWPSGSWKCRWAYFSAVVMYKPFTVPMWVCLTVCCHYTFADHLFEKKSYRDPKTGTAHGAPFTRSKVTLCMMILVASMQLMWLMGSMSISLPLVMLFFPVVILFAFFIPFFALFIPQKLISLFLKRTSSESDKDDKVQETSLGKNLPKRFTAPNPVSIEETVFALKASTTQLVSVLVLSFIFLPIFSDFSEWRRYAREFLSFSLSVPRLRLMFEYTFSWPEFEQPRLSVQLAIGVMITAIQVAFRLCKRIMLTHSWALMLSSSDNNNNNVYLRAEMLVGTVFSASTWSLFRKLTTTTQAALDVTWITNKQIWSSIFIHKKLASGESAREKYIGLFFEKYLCVEGNGYGVYGLEYFEKLTGLESTLMFLFVCLNPLVVLCMFIYYWGRYIIYSPQKVFDSTSTNTHIMEFADSEDTMAYGSCWIENDKKIDAETVANLAMKCPWMEVTVGEVRGEGVVCMCATILNMYCIVSKITRLLPKFHFYMSNSTFH
jgi:hypothetical protein